MFQRTHDTAADSDDEVIDDTETDTGCDERHSLSQLATARMPWGGAITALAVSREFLVVAELLHSVRALLRRTRELE